MESTISKLRAEARAAMAQAQDETALRDLQVRYLGKKGLVTGLMKELPSLAPEARAAFGKEVNDLKQELELAFEEVIKDRHRQALSGRGYRTGDRDRSTRRDRRGIRLRRDVEAHRRGHRGAFAGDT